MAKRGKSRQTRVKKTLGGVRSGLGNITKNLSRGSGKRSSGGLMGKSASDLFIPKVEKGYK